MTTQRTLFPEETASAPYQRHSETSREAAEAIEPRAVKLREQVRCFLLSCGPAGATDEEMQICLEMNPNTQRPRRRELVLGGAVIDSGKTRNTKSGRKAVVWVGAKWGRSEPNF
jgi:hypothetical protein